MPVAFGGVRRRKERAKAQTENVEEGLGIDKECRWTKRMTEKDGAEDEIRTRDLLLGKEAFYR